MAYRALCSISNTLLALVTQKWSDYYVSAIWCQNFAILKTLIIDASTMLTRVEVPWISIDFPWISHRWESMRMAWRSMGIHGNRFSSMASMENRFSSMGSMENRFSPMGSMENRFSSMGIHGSSTRGHFPSTFWRHYLSTLRHYKHGSNLQRKYGSNFDLCFSKQNIVSTHVAIEASMMFNTIDVDHSVLFDVVHPWITSKFLKKYVEITLNMSTQLGVILFDWKDWKLIYDTFASCGNS